MEKLLRIIGKKEHLVIGLMSGTSADGVDAALVRISGGGVDTKVELVEFEEFTYDYGIRDAIFKLFDVKSCTADYLCMMNFLLGELFAGAALDLIKKACLKPDDIDLIGSHGQTVYHAPKLVREFGYDIRSTLQIGEPAVIADRTGILTVADFRVRDMAAGGQGAPLVPYTEFILYRDAIKNIGLLNIGGIANITVLPANCTLDDVFAFDNGPGNMVIDEVVKRVTKEKMKFDEGGKLSARGKVNERLLDLLMQDGYFALKPPKTTGREYFGTAYVDRVMKCAKELEIDDTDVVATVTALTARSVYESCRDYVIPRCDLDKIIIGGGGSFNRMLLSMLRGYMPEVEIITQEESGYSSKAKEAVAFAVLANETVAGNCNNVPEATGAKNRVVMGKLNF